MAMVQLLKQDGLAHEFSVTVPQQEVESKRRSRLLEIGKTAKLPGFRPGRIPLNVIEQRHGEAARAEAIDEVISDAAEKTLSERKLRPAQPPKIELIAFAAGKDVEFKMSVEVLPEVKVADLSTLKLERVKAEVAAEEVDKRILQIAKRLVDPEPVADSRPAKMGDVLVIDFDGSVDGEKRPDMKGEDHRLELGSKSFIDTFEEQLVGSKAGEHKSITVTFPARYHAAELAGKAAVFEVAVKELRAAPQFELNDDLAKKIGFPALLPLRERVTDDVTREYEGLRACY